MRNLFLIIALLFSLHLNAQVKTKDLPNATTINSGDAFIVDQNVTTKKIAFSKIDSVINKRIKDSLASLANVAKDGKYSSLTGKPSLANVATSGNYDDLNGRITTTSQLTNNSGFIAQSDSNNLYITPYYLSTHTIQVSLIDTTGIHDVNGYFAISPDRIDLTKGLTTTLLVRANGIYTPSIDRFINDGTLSFDKTINTVNVYRLYYDGVKYHSSIVSTWTDATTKQMVATPIIAVNSISASQINVTWSNIPNNIGYYVFKSLNGKTFTKDSVVKDTCIYRVTGLANGTKLWFKVIAKANYSNYRNSNPSNIAFNTSGNSSPPTVVTDSTSVNGLTIGIRLSKSMSDPSNYMWQFTASNRTVTTAALKSGNSKVIELSVDRAYNYGDTVKVSYQQQNITAVDGGVLQGFTNTIVTNNVTQPTYFSFSNNNTANYLRAVPTSSLNFGNGVNVDGAQSISFDIYPTAFNANNIVYSRMGDYTNNACLIVYWSSDGKVTFQLYSDFTYNNNISGKFGTAMTLNAWNKVIVEYDGSSSNNGFSGYLNDVAQTITKASAGTYTAQTNTYFINVGYGPASFSYAFTGQTQEIAVYNKVLNSSEAHTVYLGGDLMSTSLHDNIMAYWHLNGNGNDASGHGNNLSNKGTPVWSVNHR